GISPAAQPFFAALLRHLFPNRPIVVVADGLKTQEIFHQDIETWLKWRGTRGEGRTDGDPQSAIRSPQSLFYPAWEILPHEARLPHADVISERLETLVALSESAARRTPHVPLVVTNVTALLQRTFPLRAIAERT